MRKRQRLERALHMMTLGAAACDACKEHKESETWGEVGEPGRLRFIPMKLKEEADRVRRDTRKWASMEGIQGIGLGEKEPGKKGNPCVTVCVEKKLPKYKCKKPIPETMVINGEKFYTDVIAIGKLRLEADLVRQKRVPPGVSVSTIRDNVAAGTLGCLVRKRNKPRGSLYILSNAHVLTDWGIGEGNDTIVQPGKSDGGVKGNHSIAKLWQWSKFEFGPDKVNTVDAAIAKVINKSAVEAQIPITGGPTGVRSQRPTVGMPVQKVGRTSSRTTGEILVVNFTMPQPLSYKTSPKRWDDVYFQDQVLCTHFTSPGDSGSLVLDTQDRAVGLHFAGSNGASVFNRIQNVLDWFEVELVTRPSISE